MRKSKYEDGVKRIFIDDKAEIFVNGYKLVNNLNGNVISIFDDNEKCVGAAKHIRWGENTIWADDSLDEENSEWHTVWYIDHCLYPSEDDVFDISDMEE